MLVRGFFRRWDPKYYGLHVYVSPIPDSYDETPNPQCDVIWRRRGLVMKMEPP